MITSRKITLNEHYSPIPTNVGDEIYPIGLFRFNITKIYEHINDGALSMDEELIDVSKWFTNHYRGSVNEDHLPAVDVTRMVIQAEIRPGMYEIIDGNHRMEKAYREGVKNINSYKFQGEQLIPYFINKQAYITFVDYWNTKLNE